MRVLQVGPYGPPHGGVQANLSAIRSALLARGDTCPVLVLRRSIDTEGEEPDIFRPGSVLQLTWLLWKIRYDVIHLHIGGNLTLRLLGLALLCTLVPGRRTVLTFHSGGYPTSHAGKNARPMTLRGFVFRRLTRIIGVNEQIVETFRRFGVCAEKVRLIYPYSFCLPSRQTIIPEEWQSFFRAHSPVLISVGLLEPEYDLALQIEVLDLVREQFPKAGLILIGSGSLEEVLRGRIAETTYARQILLCGDVAHDLTLRVMERCDLMLRTTLYDGDSISVREALHLGLPVVATDTAVRPEGVDVIPAADVKALHGAIKRGLARGRWPQDEGMDGQANIRAVLALYQEVLGGHLGTPEDSVDASLGRLH